MGLGVPLKTETGQTRHETRECRTGVGEF